MEFRGWTGPDFHCSLPISPENCYYPVPYEECMDAPGYGDGRECEPRSVPLPAMQRYLDEPDRSLFTSYAPDADGSLFQPWMGKSVHPVDHLRSRSAVYDHHHRMASPASNNSFSACSSYVSSNVGEPPEVSSWSSPEVALLDCVPGTAAYHDQTSYAYDHSFRIKREDSQPRDFGSCVALHEVQTHADEQPDESTGFEDDGIAYTGYMGYMDAEEGYQPLDATNDDRRESERVDSVYQTPPETVDPGMSSNPASPHAVTSPRHRDPSSSPNIRRRRPAPAHSSSSTHHRDRVSKRRGTTATITARYADDAPPSRAFPCSLAIYGCTSTFGSKNEWKRHINTQHMRLDFWRCDQCPATCAPTRPSSNPTTTNPHPSPASTSPLPRKFNDFNRKDLFIQHVRRMHPASIAASLPETTTSSSSSLKTPSKRPPHPTRSTSISSSSSSSLSSAQLQAQAARAQDAALMAIAARCRRRTRSPPAESACLFCPARFRGEDTWDERLEHIGRHFEGFRKGEGQGQGQGKGRGERKREEDGGGEEAEAEAEGRGSTRRGSTDPRTWRVDASVEGWMLEEGIVVRAGRGRGLVIAT